VKELAPVKRPDLVAKGDRVLVLPSLSRGNPDRVRKTRSLRLGGQGNNDGRAQQREIIGLENHRWAASSLLVVTFRRAKINQPNLAAPCSGHG
jgi:hypothetical protein